MTEQASADSTFQGRNTASDISHKSSCRLSLISVGLPSRLQSVTIFGQYHRWQGFLCRCTSSME